MKFIAYGIPIDCDFSAGAAPVMGDEGKQGVRVAAGSYAFAENETSFCTDVIELHGRQAFALTDRPLGSVVDGQPWTVVIDKLLKFQWRVGSREMRYEILGGEDHQVFYFWLVHLLLPFSLSLERRYVFLHASSVEIEGKAAVFLAPSHAGKSTLAGVFDRHGHALVSDDKLATYQQNETFSAVPSHGKYRPYREFEDLGIDATHFSHEQRVISAVYFLRRQNTQRDITISRVRGVELFDSLVTNHLYGPYTGIHQQMIFFGKLQNRVPGYAIEYPSGLDRLEEVYQAICSHERD